MNAKVVTFAVSITFLAAIGSCTFKDREIRRLNNKITKMENDAPYEAQEVCRQAVYTACIRYADCAVVPIEAMQHRICPDPE